MSRKEDKLKDITQFLQELEPMIPSSYEIYEEDYKARAICERYFEKILEAVVDIAHIIIKELKLPPATEDINAFEILAEKKIISEDLAKKLKDAKGMRNIIAHEYGEVNDELVFEAVSEQLIKDINEFLDSIKKVRLENAERR